MKHVVRKQYSHTLKRMVYVLYINSIAQYEFLDKVEALSYTMPAAV